MKPSAEYVKSFHESVGNLAYKTKSSEHLQYTIRGYARQHLHSPKSIIDTLRYP